MLLDVAHVVAMRSTCSRRRVGAVLALDGRVLSIGYNGAPAGTPHCEHREDVKEGGCQISVHAEMNALLYAARHGTAVEGATMFTTLSPCVACASAMINAGLTKVVYADTYRDGAGLDLLYSARMIVLNVRHVR